MIKRFLPEITVFFSGAIIMIYELVGTRVLGPYYGTSIYVWTNLIGIFLGSLSIGYYLGGKLADKHHSRSLLSNLILVAGLLILVTLWLKEPLLKTFSANLPSPGLGSALAAIILFLPSSLILGMVSPLAGKLKIHALGSVGVSLGTLYAVSTTGSIVGTYLAGYWLIPHLGTNRLLLSLAATLVILSLLIASTDKVFKFFALAFVLLNFSLLTKYQEAQLRQNFFDYDTPYNRVWIHDQNKDTPLSTHRIMGINAENHSSMYLHRDELANRYTEFFHLARHFVPDFQTSLMLGGAGYSFPKEYLRVYPHASLDVVEIDPGVTALARKYFRLVDDPRLNIIHADARHYLNHTQATYDVILSDVFGSRYSVPFHLTTVEAVTQLSNRLSDDGVVIVNLISSITGTHNRYLTAQSHTFAQVFPQIHLFVVDPDRSTDQIQNLILVATKSSDHSPLTSPDPVINDLLTSKYLAPLPSTAPLLTDDFAPIEYYMHTTI